MNSFRVRVWVVHRGNIHGQNTDPHPDGLLKWTTQTVTLIIFGGSPF